MSNSEAKDTMLCPECGAPIDIQNDYRCSRFPVCTYQMDRKGEFDIRKDSLIIFDLETTGTDPRKDRIIEIGALKIKNGTVKDTFSMLLNPGKTQKGTQIYISSEITRITGITNSDIENCLSESEGVNDFIHWSEGIDILCGHNIDRFDIPMLRRACKRANIPFGFRYSIDTLKFVKSLGLKKQGLIQNEKQTTLAEYYGIKYNAHRASDDAEALYKILIKMAETADPVLLPISTKKKR